MRERTRKLGPSHAILLICALLAPTAWGDDFTFTGNGAGANGRWTGATNWNNGSPAGPPGATDTAILATTADEVDLNNTAVSVGSVTFNRENDFTLSPAGASGQITINNAITAAAPSATARTYTITAPVVLGGLNTWNVSSDVGATTLTVSGAISGSQGLSKTGTGPLLLSNLSNLYSGTTTISGGTLVLSAATTNNIASSANILVGSGAALDVTGLTGNTLTLASAQTLRGGGTVYGGVSAPSGSTIAPGSSAGQLTFAGTGGITLATGSTLEMELGSDSTPGATYDQVVVDGAGKSLTTGGAILKLIGLAGIQTGVPYTMISATNTATIDSAALLRNGSAGGALMADATAHSQNGLSFTINYSSTAVSLTFSAVPEPAALGLILLCAPAVLGRRRRR